MTNHFSVRVASQCASLALAAILCGGCSSFTAYDTGNGVKVLALRNLQDAYPVYAPTFKSEMDFALKTQKSIVDLSVNSKYEKNVVQLYQQLDQLNADARNALISAYSKYVTSLSVSRDATERRDAAEAFDKATANVVSLTAEVRKLNAQIEGVKHSTGATEWSALFAQGNELQKQATVLKS
jgi:hypothetical protein